MEETLYRESTQESLEFIRNKRRKGSGRVSYDCFNLKSKRDRAYCSIGYSLNNNSMDGSLALVSILKGWTPSICRECKHFNNE